MPISEEILKRWSGNIGVMASPGELNHRALVIQSGCDLENDLAAAVLKALRKVNAALDDQAAIRDLRCEGGALASMKKLADVALHVGVISEEQRHDLRKLSKLRDRYAHDRDRKQLDDDAEMFKLVTDTHLYKNSRTQFAALSPQRVYLCVRDQLSEQLRAL